jgi:hypothetical protein
MMGLAGSGQIEVAPTAKLQKRCPSKTPRTAAIDSPMKISQAILAAQQERKPWFVLS